MNPKSKLIIDGALLFFAVCVLVILITSCAPFDPYAGLQVPTATAAAQMTTTVNKVSTLQRDERWGFHNLGDWTLTLTIQNRKAGH